MNTIGVLLLAAATATSQSPGHGSGQGLGKPHVGMKRLFRPHAVMRGPAPPGGMIDPAMMTAGADGMGGGPAGATDGRRFPNVRSQITFVEPVGMQIGWQTAAGGGERAYLPAQLVTPARYNFAQGYIYRLKLSNIKGRNALTLYPTIEVAPSTPATDAFLTHNPIPVQFTDEDFDQVQAGNFVTKVVYLPDPKYQELAVTGVETLVATRLEPGIDPIAEADRRGTILLVIRLGGIDLEMQGAPGVATTGPIDGVPLDGGVPLGPTTAPFIPPAGTTEPSVPLDTPPSAAPVSPDTTAAPLPGDDANVERGGDIPAAPEPGADEPAAPADDLGAPAPGADAGTPPADLPLDLGSTGR